VSGEGATDSARRRYPGWIPPFLGRAPDLPEPQLRMLGFVALAIRFENSDQAMPSVALKQIAEGPGVAESDLGSVLGTVRRGALPAFLLIPIGDWVGRRRLFLASVTGLSLATVGSGFARTTAEFVALQMLSGAFMVTCTAASFVIITEELPRQHRGWGSASWAPWAPSATASGCCSSRRSTCCATAGGRCTESA
jgi:MFS family permease